MNADRIANSYRWLEYAAFGRDLENARFDFLSHAVEARSVLILGEGDGRFLARLLEYNRQASITIVETSARMIDLARRRLRDTDHLRVKFYQADAVTCVLPDGQFDLVVAHFFFDIIGSRDAQAVIGKVSAALSPGAVWLVSEFQEPPALIRRLHARLWLWAMYRFFALATGLRVRKLAPYRKMLERCGLAEIEHRERRFGLIRSQVWHNRTPLFPHKSR